MAQEVWHGRIGHSGVCRGAGVVVHVDGLAFFEPCRNLGLVNNPLSCLTYARPSLTYTLTHSPRILAYTDFWVRKQFGRSRKNFFHRRDMPCL